MLVRQHIPWLLDGTLPQVNGRYPDTVATRLRGAEAVALATEEGRWLATREEMLGEGSHASELPVVILTGGPWTAEGLARNLRHFQFCLARSSSLQPLRRQRFLIEMDRRAYRLLPEGSGEELEAWKVPSVKGDLAVGAPA